MYISIERERERETYMYTHMYITPLLRPGSNLVDRSAWHPGERDIGRLL